VRLTSHGVQNGSVKKHCPFDMSPTTLPELKNGKYLGCASE